MELKPCPFCGSEAVIHESIKGRYYIMCSASKICTVIPSTLVYSNPNDAICLIEDATTADAVEVVRCKECHCYTPVDKRIGKCVFLIGKNQYVAPDGYCYLGERKENENV